MRTLPSTRSIPLFLALLLLTSLVGCQTMYVGLAQTFLTHGESAAPDGIDATRDIEFVQTPTGALELDVYRTRNAPEQEPRPVVLYAFGGGWMSGSRHQIVALDLFRLVDRGYALVTADYRWSTDAVFPAQIHDVKAALRWIRENAEQYGFDPNRVAILGPSAGGHLAALAGTSGGVLPLEGGRGDGSQSRVQAVVDYFGPTDFTVYIDQHRKNGLGNSDSLFFLDMLFGGPLADEPDLVQMANPIRYIDPSDPPFLIIHGDKDPVVPFQQSAMLAAALAKAGVPVTFLRIPDGDHGRDPRYASEELMEEIIQFLDASLAVER